MSLRNGKSTFQGSASFMVPRGLKHLSAGYVDDVLLTVRKMAAAGATADDMAEATGKSKSVVTGIIRRNGLVWNKDVPTFDRHAVKSAQTIGAYLEKGAYAWRPKAEQMRRDGATNREIAAACEVSAAAVGSYLAKSGVPRRPPKKVTAPPKEQYGPSRRSVTAKLIWERRRANGTAPKRKANAAKMLDLIIRMHVEALLSEGQVAQATDLDRVEIRRLADAMQMEAA